MISHEQALAWVQVAAMVLLGLCLLRIGLYGLRSLRAGQTGVHVGVSVTTSIIGVGIAIAFSWLGGTLMFSALSPLGLHVAILVIAQLTAAFAFSWTASVAYGKWIAPAVTAWFTREEAPQHG